MGEEKIVRKEAEEDALRVRFNPDVRIEFHGAKVSSDAGLLAHRELDEILGLSVRAGDFLKDTTRKGKNIQYDLVTLLRQSVYSRLSGYEDTNDANRVAIDPVFRVVLGREGKDEHGAKLNTMSRFETEILVTDENRRGLNQMTRAWIDTALTRTKFKRVVLDMDSSDSPVFGHQEGGKYNGYYGLKCYHPLFVFNQFGDTESALLREGNVHSADQWEAVLSPVIEHYEAMGLEILFRGDNAFAKPEIYEYLEKRPRPVKYVMRLADNPVLQRRVEPFLKRPEELSVERKHIIRYAEFRYQADSWDKERRVSAKIEWFVDQLFAFVNFVVTNMDGPPKAVVKWYNKRGTAEGWIKQGKWAITWTRLSCQKFVENEVRLSLFILAYNLDNFLRRLALPEGVKHWSLDSIKTKLIKTGAKFVTHSRRLVFQLAEAAIPRKVFIDLFANIENLVGRVTGPVSAATLPAPLWIALQATGPPG